MITRSKITARLGISCCQEPPTQIAFGRAKNLGQPPILENKTEKMGHLGFGVSRSRCANSAASPWPLKPWHWTRRFSLWRRGADAPGRTKEFSALLRLFRALSQPLRRPSLSHPPLSTPWQVLCRHTAALGLPMPRIWRQQSLFCSEHSGCTKSHRVTSNHVRSWTARHETGSRRPHRCAQRTRASYEDIFPLPLLVRPCALSTRSALRSAASPAHGPTSHAGNNQNTGKQSVLMPSQIPKIGAGSPVTLRYS